ncbi:MAG: S8 family serine peptidase [Ruminococcus sp.]|nr:S8 family serine peptidase [Candidatus Apopatosoma intestinale]
MKQSAFRVWTRILSVFLMLGILLGATSCALTPMLPAASEETGSPAVKENVPAIPGTVGEMAQRTSAISGKTGVTAPKTGEYQEGSVLVKYEGEAALTAEAFGEVAIVSVEPLYRDSVWYQVLLANPDETVSAVEALSALGTFEAVDYDYVMKGDGDAHSVDISANAETIDVAYLDAMGIRDAWDFFVTNEKHPGGSPDVIVAVIDTGVDYNHIDLNRNIWRNPGEIPNNGIDDDGNGYIDDVYGWNFVGDNNDPMDDNGHGTHVAGIIAADNNAFGVVGVAYNCKVMCLKAGTSSGTFNNSDIAEAIIYAYMNGASVINMSFGGTSISMAVEDALEDAYNQCVLVAAAGNDDMCNQPGCPAHNPEVEYPAALTYVIGVMSCNAAGTSRSSFSNFDHWQYNTVEYDVYAPGEQIPSTFPNNKYASLSGTSMACPNVAGIAALLRSEFTDREKYSTKFITSQIVANGGKEVGGYYVANAYNAINNIPKPNIYGIHDYYIFDDPKFSANNNGNGIIEAGETIHLGFELMNRGGKATDVTVSVNTERLAADITDPYIHILSNDITYSDIGTYSIRDGGKIYDDNGKVIDVEHPIVIKIDEETPNDYLSKINFTYVYKNGLDSKDETVYSGNGSVSLTVTNGFILPEVIIEDTVFTANRRYIITHDVTIPVGVTVIFEEGCNVQFYANPNDIFVDTVFNSPTLIVHGNVFFNGTETNVIKIHPSETYWDSPLFVDIIQNEGKMEFSYCETTNVSATFGGALINYYKSSIIIDKNPNSYLQGYRSGSRRDEYSIITGNLESCYVDIRRNAGVTCWPVTVRNCVLNIGNEGGFEFSTGAEFENNLVLIECEYPNGGGRISIRKNGLFDNNSFLLKKDLISIQNILPFIFEGDETEGKEYQGNIFDSAIRNCLPIISSGFFNSYGMPMMNVNDIAHHDDNVIWPYVKNIEIFNSDGEAIRTVGSGKATVKVTFNRPMDKSVDFKLYYGSVAPYRDYVINGEYAEDGMSWTGEFQIKANIEGGRNFFSAGDGCAADDSFKTLINNAPAFTFDIDMTSAMSMNLQGVGTADGIALTWVQDDYDTLMGYNVYRSDSKDGNFVRINPSVIPAGENTYLDTDAEPGKLYWYTFTVVLSDFTESKPAGKVSCRSADTINPTVYHTPVNQGYAQNNLVISCTARDNIAIDNVKLYYRTSGETAWKTLTMAKQNDKFSATVFGSDVTLAGLEYYIVVSDGRNEVNKGTAEAPYSVVVKDASALSTCGDVDGDGVVTTKDALMLIEAINGDLLLSDDQFKRADLNKDQTLSSAEALRILQYINGKITVLEM